MSLSPQELGEHLIVGLAGPSLLEIERRLLQELRPLGIILFKKNFLDPGDDWIPALQRLIADARQATGRVDFLVSVDHEGGRVHRFFDPVTHFPAAARYKSRARDVGYAMGRELCGLGFNLDFAPVCDIHSEPANTVIGDRAFGNSPQSTADVVGDFLTGLEDGGVIGCGKHFPGHGATVADSHFELPRLDLSLEEISKRELIPFQAIIARGLSLMMTAHVVYSKIDPGKPATYSKVILEDLLRSRLGFEGAIISDDLEMKALASQTPAERALLAFEAGVDILLEANPKAEVALEVSEAMLRGLADSIYKSPALSKRLERSKEYVARFRRHAATVFAKSGPADIALVGAAEHQRLAEMTSKMA